MSSPPHMNVIPEDNGRNGEENEGFEEEKDKDKTPGPDPTPIAPSPEANDDEESAGESEAEGGEKPAPAIMETPPTPPIEDREVNNLPGLPVKQSVDILVNDDKLDSDEESSNQLSPKGKKSGKGKSKFNLRRSAPNALVSAGLYNGGIVAPTEEGAKNNDDFLKSFLNSEGRGALARRRMPLLPPGTEITADGEISTRQFSASHLQMYVEMIELRHISEIREYVWLQKSRWIKYEEEVEPEARRWGNPHVPSLSFYTLVELKKLMHKGVMLLDDRSTCLSELTASVTQAWVDQGMLTEEQAEIIALAIELPHKHLTAKGSNTFYHDSQSGGRTRQGRMMSSADITQVTLTDYLTTNKDRVEDSNSLQPTPEATPTASRKSRAFSVDIATILSTLARRPSGLQAGDRRPSRSADTHRDKTIAQRFLGHSAEGAVVLSGFLESLKEPLFAMIRLSSGQDMGDIIEADVPLRFAFLLFGAPHDVASVNQMAHCLGAMMANKKFAFVAYNKDNERAEIFEELDNFLQKSVVIPPGDWDDDFLVPSIMRAQSAAGAITSAPAMSPSELQVVVTEPAEVDVVPRSLLDKEVLPSDVDDPLVRTKRLFGGMIKDVKRRYVKYKSDITDGLNTKCLAGFFFLYFVCLAPAITFGGLLNQKTQRYMGISEALLGISVLGVVFHLFAAQPLMIIGTTGPALIFEESVFTISNLIGWEYMPFRCWVLFWLFIVTLVVVMFDGSCLIKLISRFTEEIFGLLISLIFIYEVFNKLYVIFQKYPLLLVYDEPWRMTCSEEGLVGPSPLPPANETSAGPADSVVASVSQAMLGILQMFFNSSITVPSPVDDNGTAIIGPAGNNSDQTYSCSKSYYLDDNGPLPNTAMMSFLLTMGTFLIAYFFRIFRTMHFFGKTARRILGDFGVPIAIAVMVIVDVMEPNVYTQKLDVPKGITVTDEEKRDWFINPLGMNTTLPVAAMFAAVIPAILYFILLFLETMITSILVNKRLKKGTGFHLDLMIVGAFSIPCALLGWPLVSFATVRALAHVSALCVYDTVVAPGEKPKLVEVKEQRLTGVLAHILVGVSIAMEPILKEVPIAVLFGVFLYMGVTSLFGMQLTDRIILLFQPVKHHPPVPYVTTVRTWKMHVFTLIQIAFLVVMWAVKSTVASLAFPFVILLTIPVRRYLLKYMFTQEELGVLDMKGGD